MPYVRITWARQPADARLVLGSFRRRPTDAQVDALRRQYPDFEFEFSTRSGSAAKYRTQLVTDKPVVKITWCPQPVNIGEVHLPLGVFDHPPTEEEVNQLRRAYPYIEFER